MSCLRSLFILLFALFFCCLNFDLAASDHQYEAEIVNFETVVTVKNKKLIKQYAYEIRINNRDGDVFGEIKIPYSSLNKISGVSGNIENAFGQTVKKLKKGDIIDRSSLGDYSFHDDNYVLEFTLKHNSYPYTIFYAYEEEQHEFLAVENWTPVLSKNIPTLKASLEVFLPLDYPVNIKTNKMENVVPDTLNDQIHYHFTGNYTTQIKPQVKAPRFQTLIPQVHIVPQNFEFEIPGSFTSWKTYGNWEYALNEGLNDLPDMEIKKIRQLTENIPDTVEKIKVLYHYLQDATRYINVSLETGGMKPHPASYVAKNKYGDCKALSNYFQTALAEIGIKSYYTDVNANDGQLVKIDTAFPSMQFNHIIVSVPLQPDTIWLDCTSKYAFNYLGTFTQNRKVLLVDKENSHFVKTPALRAKEVLFTRNVHFTFEDFNTIQASFVNTYRGAAYEQMHSLDNMVNTNEKDQIIHKKLVDRGYEMQSYSLLPQHRDSAYIQLQYEARSGEEIKQYGTETLVKILPFYLVKYEKPDDRKYPVQLDYPICKVDTLSYQIPDGVTISRLPKNLSISGKFGTYAFSIKKEGVNIQVVKRLEINPGSISLNHYPDFYDFLQKVKHHEYTSYIIVQKS